MRGRWYASTCARVSASGVSFTSSPGAYFAAQNQPTFYPEVVVMFTLDDADAHYHVPLLLSPYAYSTQCEAKQLCMSSVSASWRTSSTALLTATPAVPSAFGT